MTPSSLLYRKLYRKLCRMLPDHMLLTLALALALALTLTLNVSHVLSSQTPLSLLNDRAPRPSRECRRTESIGREFPRRDQARSRTGLWHRDRSAIRAGWTPVPLP